MSARYREELYNNHKGLEQMGYLKQLKHISPWGAQAKAWWCSLLWDGLEEIWALGRTGMKVL